MLSALNNLSIAHHSSTGLSLQAFATLLNVLSVTARYRDVLALDVSNAPATVVSPRHGSFLPAHRQLETLLIGARLPARCTVASLGPSLSFALALDEPRDFFKMKLFTSERVAFGLL